MTEIERRLRAAMHAAVENELPPANLLESVMARHRRRRTRTAVAGAALVAVGALALPPAVSASHGNPPPTAGPHRAAPGTVLDNCDSSVALQLPLGWRTGRVAVGPLWFLGLRPATAAFSDHSKLAIGELTVYIQDGATAWVNVVGSAVGHFRFLFGPDDFQYGPGGRRSTLADGENGVTLAGCPPTGSGNVSLVPGFTEFFGRYLIDKIPTSVSLDIWTPASRRPTRITFRVGY